MQKECPQCGSQFEARREGEGELCPSCARGEFRRANFRETPSPEWERQQSVLLRKQKARASKMGRVELAKKGFQPGQVVMLLLGGALVLVCALFFWVSSRSDSGILASMPEANRRFFSLFLNVAAAVLVVLAVRRRPIVAVISAAGLIVWGWLVPALWPLAVDEARPVPVAAEASAEESKPETALNKEELRILEQARQEYGADRVWGVYVDHPVEGARDQIRKFLARLSRARRVVAYSRGNGFLYVLEGTSVGEKEIRTIASRLGTTLSFSPDRRLVEVSFDARGSHYENEFSSEVLLTVGHPSFVRANLDELRCLDPTRIVSAAQNLGAARTPDFHADIRETLLSVLREPWEGQEYVSKALVSALLAYAEPHDREVLAEARRLFDSVTKLNLALPEKVTDYLVENDPDSMVEPLVELWLGNPVYWEPWLSRLGAKAQPQLLQVLEEAESLQTIGGVLKHLECEGTPDALPAIQPFENHDDDLIRNAAREAAAEIRKRAAR